MAITRQTVPQPGAEPPAAQQKPVLPRPRSAAPRGGPAGLDKARFDLLVDALNRLPRPAVMALLVAMLAHAALDPDGFSGRMRALAEVPEPLWWLQGVIVTLFFGAREAHYLRGARTGKPTAKRPAPRLSAAKPKPRTRTQA